MGFKLPGKSVHSGTSSHKSALTMKSEYDAAAKYKAEQAAAKMYDSPADMALKGDQHKLPQHLKDGIEAAPEPGSSPNKPLNKVLKKLHLQSSRILLNLFQMHLVERLIQQRVCITNYQVGVSLF